MTPTIEQLINILRNYMKELQRELKQARAEVKQARAEVERVRKLWNESHIKERDDFAKEIERVKAEFRK